MVGVGAGLGAALARRFAASYAVALMARDQGKLQDFATEITAAGGRALTRHPSGAVTRGRRVVVHGLGRQVRPIDSGILLRRSEQPTFAPKKTRSSSVTTAAPTLIPL